jgi:hypothetical protein
MRRVLAASFAVLSLSLVMGACSSDSKKVADIVQSNIKKETGVQDVKVTCDGSLEAKKGSKGSCTAAGDFSSYLASKNPAFNGVKITELKLDIEFADDTTFNFTLNADDLQAKLTAASGGTATSPSDSSVPVETESSSS